MFYCATLLEISLIYILPWGHNCWVVVYKSDLPAVNPRCWPSSMISPRCCSPQYLPRSAQLVNSEMLQTAFHKQGREREKTALSQIWSLSFLSTRLLVKHLYTACMDATLQRLCLVFQIMTEVCQILLFAQARTHYENQHPVSSLLFPSISWQISVSTAKTGLKLCPAQTEINEFTFAENAEKPFANTWKSVSLLI